MQGDISPLTPPEGDGGRARKGPRHAAPRKSLLTRLQLPAGKAMALAAMPTAVLVGMGLTPRMALADEKEIPFAPGPCVTRSDEPVEPTKSPPEPSPSTSVSPVPSPSPSRPTAEPDGPDGSEEPGDDGDDGREEEDARPGASPSAQDLPGGAQSASGSGPTSSPKPSPSASKTRNPLDPLGVGDAVKDLIEGLVNPPARKSTGDDEKKPSDRPTATGSAGKPAGKPEAKPAGKSHGKSDGKPPQKSDESGAESGAVQGEESREDPDDEAPDGPDDASTGASEGTDRPTADPEPSADSEARPSADPTKEAIKEAAEQVGATVKELDEEAKGLEPKKDEDVPDGAKPRFPCPTADPEALAAAELEPGIPLLPEHPWVLRSSVLTLRGLNYHGIVEVRTGAGTVKKALKFTASSVDIKDLHQTARYPGGSTMHVKAREDSTSTIRQGTVTMYTESLKGNLFGIIPVTFSPQTPPPLDVPFAVFTDVTVRQAGQFGGTLTVPGLRNYVETGEDDD
ncbi:hypothetical protein [Streptomyces sp. NBC_00690]|uniref:hypothetical protein n=1 Tax=Streptomyces sp. NBC_00690 TaxID=2975808 RepID=UPI002E29002E|nr:hypothetical protein [Streptomyces sp. NBC_00690]